MPIREKHKNDVPPLKFGAVQYYRTRVYIFYKEYTRNLMNIIAKIMHI